MSSLAELGEVSKALVSLKDHPEMAAKFDEVERRQRRRENLNIPKSAAVGGAIGGLGGAAFNPKGARRAGAAWSAGGSAVLSGGMAAYRNSQRRKARAAFRENVRVNVPDQKPESVKKMSDDNWKNITQRQTEITRANKGKRQSDAAAAAGLLGLGTTGVVAQRRGDIRQRNYMEGGKLHREFQLGIKPEYSRPLGYDKAQPKPFGIRKPVHAGAFGMSTGPKEMQAVAGRFKGRASLPYGAALMGSGALLSGGAAASAYFRGKRRYNEKKIADMRKERYARTGKRVGPAR